MMTVGELREADDDSAIFELRELTRAGRNTEALATARAMLRRAPLQRDALYGAAVNLRRLGRTMEAIETLDVLEAAHPGYGRGFEERGLCQIALDDSTPARISFERAVALNPALAASWEMLTHLSGPAQASVATQHLEQLRRLPPAIVEAGGWFSDGDYTAAQTRLEAFVASDGRHVEALRLLGRVAQRRGALERAESLLREAVESAPTYVAARLDLVRVLIERQKYAAALDVDDAEASDGETQFLRATALAGLARHEEAVALFRELAYGAPTNNQVWIVLGHSLKALGRTREAIHAYRHATRGGAHVGDAYWSLANLKTYQFADAEVERMRVLEAWPGFPERAELCFAIGKSLEDRADYAQSWAFYERANALAREKRRYRPETTKEDALRLRQLFTAEFFAERAGVGDSAADPIFIVGLPRSGSTLLEQILASHRQVDGTQELYEIPRIVAEWSANKGARYPQNLADLDPQCFERLGKRYLDEVEPYRSGRPRFVDKMPNNFWHIGLIHLMLPNAKIIEIRRHPLAVCVGNYRQHYARGQHFSYAIDDLAGYYRTYAEVMRHWSETLVGRVLTVAYEDVVEALESSVRRILTFCELEFDPACLDFHHNKRIVNTPSSEQVRQPLFRDGLSSWRRFEPWLEPLRAALGDEVRYWENRRACQRPISRLSF